MALDKPVREPFTCRPCYEDRGVNVKLETAVVGHDNRSVETELTTKCPECGYVVGGIKL